MSYPLPESVNTCLFRLQNLAPPLETQSIAGQAHPSGHKEHSQAPKDTLMSEHLSSYANPTCGCDRV